MRGGAFLRFSVTAGSSGSTSVYCQPTRAHPVRAPAGIFRRHLRCSAPRTAPLIHDSVHPCTASNWWMGERLLLLLLLRQDAAETPPPEARRAHEGTARRVARRMRASSLNAHGRASSEPRSAIAHSQGRMPEERAVGGGLLFGYFLLATQEKVTRSPIGRVEASLLARFKKAKTQDSGLRRNDEVRKHHPHPILPLKGRAEASAAPPSVI